MKALTRADYELLTEAQRVIQSNYDEAEQNHTVGAAVRCKSGNVYAGVNVYSLHGACAEPGCHRNRDHAGRARI